MTRLGGGEGGGEGEGKCKRLLRKDKVLSSSVPEILVWISKNNSKSNFPEFLVQWLAFRKRNKFPFLRQLSKEIFVPFASVSKVVKLLVELMNTPKSK